MCDGYWIGFDSTHAKRGDKTKQRAERNWSNDKQGDQNEKEYG
ncbi:hypothetical protein HORM4_830012 [Vibrio harveyi]|nr:hypothetical protein HORM4_830012 [Vibrio harveyi]